MLFLAVLWRLTTICAFEMQYSINLQPCDLHKNMCVFYDLTNLILVLSPNMLGQTPPTSFKASYTAVKNMPVQLYANRTSPLEDR